MSLKALVIVLFSLRVNCIPLPPTMPSYSVPPVYGVNHQNHPNHQQAYQPSYSTGGANYQQTYQPQQHYNPQYSQQQHQTQQYPSGQQSYQHQPSYQQSECLQYYCYRFEMPNVTVTSPKPAPPKEEAVTAAPASTSTDTPNLLFENLFHQKQFHQEQSYPQNPFLFGGRMPGSSSGPQLFLSPEPRSAGASSNECSRRVYFFCSAVSISSSYQPVAACPSYLCSVPTSITQPTGCDPFNCQLVE